MAPPTEPAVTEPAEASASELQPRLKGFGVEGSAAGRGSGGDGRRAGVLVSSTFNGDPSSPFFSSSNTSG